MAFESVFMSGLPVCFVSSRNPTLFLVLKVRVGKSEEFLSGSIRFLPKPVKEFLLLRELRPEPYPDSLL